MQTIKGPGIFLAKFLRDEPPYNALEVITGWVFDLEAFEKAPENEKATVQKIELRTKKSKLKMVALLPAIILVFFTCLAIYFKRRVGYSAIMLNAP